MFPFTRASHFGHVFLTHCHLGAPGVGRISSLLFPSEFRGNHFKDENWGSLLGKDKDRLSKGGLIVQRKVGPNLLIGGSSHVLPGSIEPCKLATNCFFVFVFFERWIRLQGFMVVCRGVWPDALTVPRSLPPTPQRTERACWPLSRWALSGGTYFLTSSAIPQNPYILGLPLVPFYPKPSPTKVNYRKKGTFILTSLLEDLV